MEKHLYDSYIKILEHELIPALGCTEPGAVAYAASQARTLLGRMPDHLDVWCSGNIVKNVKGVAVPNSGGMKGIDSAAVLGSLIEANRCADGSLEVLSYVTPDEIDKAKELLRIGFCSCFLEEDTPNLYIKAAACADGHTAEIVIKDSHANIVSKVLDGRVILSADSVSEESEAETLKNLLSVKGILDFADCLAAKDVDHILQPQISANTAIAEEGLSHPYGAGVGKTILDTREKTAKNVAVAKAAAGSDARMSGCIMPVVINSGSGNQGITVTVPVVEYAKEIGADEETLYRALAISNLISIHIKNHIGKLSAFCGAVSAACGSGSAIAYLQGADYEQISATISNTLGNVGGIVCDGAKASCAAKIASSLDAALLGYDMARQNLEFKSGEGFIMDDIEETIDNIGKIGKYGMKSTDKEILNLMLGNKDYICD